MYLNSKGNLNNLLFLWESWFPNSQLLYKTNPFKFEPKIDVYNSEYDFLNLIEENYFKGRMLSDYLRKSDMMSMYNSIEFRVPMLDEDLVNYSISIPYYLKGGGLNFKRLFKALHGELFGKYYAKQKKKGFRIPLDTWLGKENLLIMKAFLVDHEINFYTRFIEKDYVRSLFDYINNGNDYTYVSREACYQRILIVYSLELWYKENYLD
jgi:asparagine synthase (glutamine-hydrolysing)